MSNPQESFDDNIHGEHSSHTFSLEQSVMALARALRIQRSQVLTRYNLSGIGYDIIRILLSEKENTIGQLTRALHANTSQTSREVNRLVNKELLSRRRPVDDRRVVLVSLTEQGEKLGLELRRLAAYQEEFLAESIEAEELDTCRHVIEKMLFNLEGRPRRPVSAAM